MRLKLIANNRNYCEIESADSNIRKSLGKSPIHLVLANHVLHFGCRHAQFATEIDVQLDVGTEN